MTYINHWASSAPHAVFSQLVTSNTTEHLKYVEGCYDQQREAPVHEEVPDDSSIDCIVLYAITWGHVHQEHKARQDLIQTIMQTGRADYKLYVSEYYMKLENKHMLPAAKDQDWHCPLVVSIKNEDASN